MLVLNKIVCLTSFDFYLKCLTWWHFNFESFRTCLPNISQFEMFQFLGENIQFPKRTPMTMNHLDMKISKFSNRLLFYMHVGDCLKVKFHYGTSINNGQMKLKITFNRCYVSVEQNSLFNFIWLLFKILNVVKLQFWVIPRLRAKY